MCCFPAMFSFFFKNEGKPFTLQKGTCYLTHTCIIFKYFFKKIIFISTAEQKIRYGMYFSAYVEVDTARRTAEACACLRVVGSGLAIAFLRCH